MLTMQNAELTRILGQELNKVESRKLAFRPRTEEIMAYRDRK